MDEAEISLNDVLGALKKRWALIVLPTLIVSVLTWVYAHNLPKEYESVAMIRLGFVGSDPVESVGAATAVMKSEQLREQIAAKVGHAQDNDYIDSLTDLIEYTDAAGMLQIAARYTDPAAAQKLTEVVSSLVLERQKLIFETEKKNLSQLVTYVKENIRPMPLSSGLKEFRLSESELAVPANLPKKPVPSKKHYTSVAFALSLIMMGFLALFLERNSIVKPVK